MALLFRYFNSMYLRYPIENRIWQGFDEALMYWKTRLTRQITSSPQTKPSEPTQQAPALSWGPTVLWRGSAESWQPEMTGNACHMPLGNATFSGEKWSRDRCLQLYKHIRWPTMCESEQVSNRVGAYAKYSRGDQGTSTLCCFLWQEKVRYKI